MRLGQFFKIFSAERSLSSEAALKVLSPLVIKKIAPIPEAVLLQQKHEEMLAAEKGKSFQLFFKEVMSGNDKVRWDPESKQGVEPF